MADSTSYSPKSLIPPVAKLEEASDAALQAGRTSDMADVPVVVLAGGKGTRLRPFTASFPKPLVPLGDMPILEVVLRQLAMHGFRDVTLSLGHLSELIEAYIGSSPWISSALDVSTITETTPSGTAGSLTRVPGLDSTFVVMNGDVLTDLDYADLVRQHKASGAALTIAAHTKDVRIDLGVLETSDDGELVGYIEKPTQHYDVSMGIYVYEPRVLAHIREGEYLDFPTLVQQLLAAGETVRIHRNPAFWLDIGRPDDYARAQDIFETQPEIFGIERDAA